MIDHNDIIMIGLAAFSILNFFLLIYNAYVIGQNRNNIESVEDRLREQIQELKSDIFG